MTKSDTASLWKWTGLNLIFSNQIKDLAAAGPLHLTSWRYSTFHSLRQRLTLSALALAAECTRKSRLSWLRFSCTYCSNVWGWVCPALSYSSLLAQYWLVTNALNRLGLQLVLCWWLIITCSSRPHFVGSYSWVCWQALKTPHRSSYSWQCGCAQ